MNQGIIVFGANGFIGTRLVSRAARRGQRVTAVDIAPPRIRLDGVDYVYADVRKPIPVNIGRPCDTIYNLAAIHRTPGHPAHEYYETNVLGALNVTRFADAIGAIDVLFTSSISVYGPNEAAIDEESPLTPTSDYGRSKMMAEEIHRRWLQGREGRRLVVARPGVVFGPGERGNFTSLARFLKKGVFAYPGRKSTVKSGGHVDELLRAFDFTLSRNSDEITFNFAYPDESTTGQIVERLGRILGTRTSYPVMPIAPLLLVAGGFEALAAVGLKTPIHRERIWKMVNTTRITPRWLLDNGYVFETDMEASLIAWSAETDGAFV